jgi:purine-nucleoside phosphorylase
MKYDFAYFQKSADYVRSKIDFTPEIGIILGTGCGPLADEVENPIVIPYGDIPNFLVSTNPDHAGKLILGTLAGDDTVMVVMRDTNSAAAFCGEIKSLMN